MGLDTIAIWTLRRTLPIFLYYKCQKDLINSANPSWIQRQVGSFECVKIRLDQGSYFQQSHFLHREMSTCSLNIVSEELPEEFVQGAMMDSYSGSEPRLFISFRLDNEFNG